MENDFHQMALDPVALAALAALLLAVTLCAASSGSTARPPPDTTARQDLWLARHRIASARALLEALPAEAAEGHGIHTVEAQLHEALRQIRGARSKPGWHDLPADRAAALDRALPDVEQALAILRHHSDGDTRRRVGVVLDALHGTLDRMDPTD